MTNSPIYDTPSHQLPQNTIITQVRCRKKTKALTLLSILLQILVFIALGLILYFTYKVHEEGTLNAAKNVIKFKKHVNKIVGGIIESGTFETLRKFFKGPQSNNTDNQDAGSLSSRHSGEYREASTSLPFTNSTLIAAVSQIMWSLRGSVLERRNSSNDSSLLDFSADTQTPLRESTRGQGGREDRPTSHSDYSRAGRLRDFIHDDNDGRSITESSVATSRSGTTPQWRTSTSMEPHTGTSTSHNPHGARDHLYATSRSGRFGDLGEIPLSLIDSDSSKHSIISGRAGHGIEARDNWMFSWEGNRIPRSPSLRTTGGLSSVTSTSRGQDWKTEHGIRLETQLQGSSSGIDPPTRVSSADYDNARNSLDNHQNRTRRHNLRGKQSSISTHKRVTTARPSGQYTGSRRNNLKQRQEAYTGSQETEYLGIQTININPEVPQDAPYTTLSQTGQVITDISLSVLYATFNTSMLRTHIKKARELVRFVEKAVESLSTNTHAKTPAEDAPGTQMLLDISDAITLFEERCVRLWSISTSMAGDLKTDDFVPKQHRGPRTLATQAELIYPDPQIIDQAIPEELRNQSHIFTWRQLLNKFPRPSCYDKESILDCTQEEQQRVELFQLATIYVMENDSSVLPAIQDLLTTLEIEVLTPPTTYVALRDDEQRSKRGVIAVGVRLLGIVVSIFSGLTYAGILGGPSTKEINQVIFDEKTPVGAVNDKSKSLDNVYRDTPDGHERVLV